TTAARGRRSTILSSAAGRHSLLPKPPVAHAWQSSSTLSTSTSPSAGGKHLRAPRQRWWTQAKASTRSRRSGCWKAIPLPPGQESQNPVRQNHGRVRPEVRRPDMRGRRPKPTRLKVITGNPGKRPLNEHEPRPEPQIPPCPSELSP